jgi:SAM-dependent methyltransferase
MDKFYQQIKWLELKSKILDDPAYSISIHDRLKKRKYFDSVLDCGTGTGLFALKLSQMIEFNRLLGFDINEDLIKFAKDDTLSHLPENIRRSVQFVVQDLFSESKLSTKMQFDLITGQAFLEHTRINESIEILSEFCKEGGWMYFPHNYSGLAVFEPAYDPVVERQILENFNIYNIETQKYGDRLCGDSQCGQKLPFLFEKHGFQILNFSTSDWVLTAKGQFNKEEKEILNFIIDIFYDANDPEKNPIPISRRLPRETLKGWRSFHKKNIEEHKLTFICLQTSILVEK